MSKVYTASKFFTAAEVEQFVRAYIGTALWCTTDETIYRDGKGPDTPLEANYNINDVDGDCFAAIMETCKEFMDDNQISLKTVCDGASYDLTNAGYDLWLTANGHGAGYWDADIDTEIGDILSDAARAIGGSCCWGTDGTIYFN